eukprot:GEMP01000367.1.p1 GENE.GEMP01000367.1~~GEMP01000367.1.p1  ORF type:complete len:2231 (+),score=524.89 GEMP01000367.1:559-6693(+)
MKACERDREQGESDFATCALQSFFCVMEHSEAISQKFVRNVAIRLFDMPHSTEHLHKLVCRWPLTVPANFEIVAAKACCFGLTRTQREAVVRLGCYWAMVPSREVQRVWQVGVEMINEPFNKGDSLAELAWVLEVVNNGLPAAIDIVKRFTEKMKNRPPLRIVAQTLREDWPAIEEAGCARALEDFLRLRVSEFHTQTQDMMSRMEEIRRMFSLDIVEPVKQTFTNNIEPALLRLELIPIMVIERFLELCLGASPELLQKAINVCISEGSALSTGAYVLLCEFECPNILDMLMPLSNQCEESMNEYEKLNSVGYAWLATRLSFHPDGFERLRKLWGMTSFADLSALHLAQALVRFGQPSSAHFHLLADKLALTKPQDSLQWLPFVKAAIKVFQSGENDNVAIDSWLKTAVEAAERGAFGAEAKIALCNFFVVLLERSDRTALRESALNGLVCTGRDAVFYDENPEVSLRCAQFILKSMMSVVEDPEMVIADITDALGPPFGQHEWTLARFGLCVEYLLLVDQNRKLRVLADMMQAAEQCNQWETFQVALSALCRRLNTTVATLLEPLKLYLVGHWASMGASIESFPWEKLKLVPAIAEAKALQTELNDDNFVCTVGAKVHKARSAFPDFDVRIETHAHDCVAASITLALQVLHPHLSDCVVLTDLPDSYDRILKTTFSNFMCLHFKYILERIDPVLQCADPLGLCARPSIVPWLQQYLGSSETNARCLVAFCNRHKIPPPRITSEHHLLPAANCSTLLTMFDPADVMTMREEWPDSWKSSAFFKTALDTVLKEMGNGGDVDAVSGNVVAKRRRVEEDALFVLEHLTSDVGLEHVSARIATASFANLYNRTVAARTLPIPDSLRVFFGYQNEEQRTARWFAWCLWWLNGHCLTDSDAAIRTTALRCLGGLMHYPTQVQEAVEWWTNHGRGPPLDRTSSPQWYQSSEEETAPSIVPLCARGKPVPIDWAGWDNGVLSPEQWISVVVTQLCQRDHRVFCIPLVKICPAFAEALLPFVWNLEVDARMVTEIIVNSPTKAPIVCRMLLRALQFARVDVLSDAQLASRATHWVRANPQLRLLRIAHACTKIDELLEALIYTEAFLEQKYGGLTADCSDSRHITSRAHRLLAEPPDYVGTNRTERQTQYNERRLEEALATGKSLMASFLSSSGPLTATTRVLQHFGEHHIIRHLECDLTSPPLVDARAEAMWRLSDWSQLDHQLSPASEWFHTCFHKALCEKAVPTKALKVAYHEYKAKQCDPLTTCVRFLMCHDATHVDVHRWAQEDLVASRIGADTVKFKALEPPLLLRHVLAQREDASDTRCAVAYVRLCRKAHRVEMGLHAADRCRTKSVELQWEEAQCLWALGEKTRAILLAHQVVNVSKSQKNPPCTPIVLAKRYGRTAVWLQELAQINNAAADLFEQAKVHGKEYPKVLYWLASFYDKRFLSYQTEQKDSGTADENQWLTKMIEKGREISRAGSRDLMIAKDTVVYEQEINSRRRTLTTYLLDVVRAYGDCLTSPMQKRMNIVASRFITLWFAQPVFLHGTVKTYLDNIDLKYLLPIFPQIVGRISSDESPFQKLIRNLVTTMCINFPLETLFSTVCLLNQRLVNQETFGGRQGANYVADSKKEAAAKMILKSVGLKSASLKEIVEAVHTVANFYHHLADQKVSPGQRQTTGIPLNSIPGYEEARKKIKLLPPITASPDNALMAGLPSTYRHVESGISCPSILEVMDSDGVRHKQLVKGRDDLRQDMVVQQLFEQLNQVFVDNGFFDSRLRTYKVVPLSPSSGVCEWVQNTVSIGGYIAQARAKYHPEDWPQAKCAKMMAPLVAKQNNVSLERKLQGFMEILKNTHPVLHLFFYEHFPDTQEWFEAKRRFRASVAVSSMVGFIIGLGDRHLQNILIDPKSGEVVHIDFGMTFDYGRSHQGIPELVPFRLTRDICSALGPMGINHGGFRKCCEDTMQTMRGFSEVITTIVEVFAYDPMVRWCNVVRDEQNGMARLAVFGVRRKLEGVDEDRTVGLSVGTLVERLLNRAIDNTRLCQMFQGWSPWC